MEVCSVGQSATCVNSNFGSFCCDQPFVCQVWLSSGLAECAPAFLCIIVAQHKHGYQDVNCHLQLWSTHKNTLFS